MVKPHGYGTGVFAIGIVLCGLGFGEAAGARHLVFGVYWLRSASDRPVRRARLTVCLPETIGYQRVDANAFYPKAAETVTDSFGNRFRQIQWDVIRGNGFQSAISCTSADTGSRRAPSTSGEPISMPEDRKRSYLRDDPMLRLPGTASAARRLAEASKDPDEVAFRFYGHIVKRFTYDRDGRWDPADIVLKRERGSCTELTYVFVSLCRNAGVPARIVTATSRRGTDRSCVDVVHHTWAEYFSPRRGWVSVDCSRGLDDPEGHFGKRQTGLLAWYGNANARNGDAQWSAWSADSSSENLRSSRVSVWLRKRKGPADWDEVNRVCREFGRASSRRAAAMLRYLRRTGSGRVVPLGLYALAHPDDAVFRQAVRAVAESGVRGSIAALVRFRMLAGTHRRGSETMGWVRRTATQGSTAERASAARDLGLIRFTESETLLIRVARDSDSHVRRCAAAALGSIGASPAAEKVLRKLTRDRDTRVAAEAERSLAHFIRRRGYPS
jgi:transglutaminase-like putative cysteine protease